MGKHKAGPSTDKKMFFDTIKDMRTLINQSSNPYIADVLGVNKKSSTKVPYNHLMGRRKTLKDRYKAEKFRSK